MKNSIAPDSGDDGGSIAILLLVEMEKGNERMRGSVSGAGVYAEMIGKGFKEWGGPR